MNTLSRMVCVVGLWIVSLVAGAATGDVQWENIPMNVEPGDEFTANLKFDLGTNNLTGFELVIQFDPDVLLVKALGASADDASLFPSPASGYSAPPTTGNDGEYGFAAFKLGGVPLTGLKSLVQVTFEVQDAAANGAQSPISVVSMSVSAAPAGGGGSQNIPANLPTPPIVTVINEDTFSLSISETCDGAGKVNVNGEVQSLPFSGDFNKNSTVQLGAVPDDGSAFGGWSGDASGSSLTTSVVMDEAKNVSACFNESNTFLLTINKTGAGSGSVEVNDIPRSLPFSEEFAEDAEVCLKAVPDSESTFDEWSGDVAGEDEEICVTMDEAKTISVAFVSDPGGWQSVSSEHTVEYGNCWERSGSVVVPGATEIRLILSQIDVEGEGDTLYVGKIEDFVKDEFGWVTSVLGEYEVYDVSVNGERTTLSVQGDRIDLLMDSDASFSGAFTIRQIEYKGSEGGQPEIEGDLFETVVNEDEDCEYVCYETVGCTTNECEHIDDKTIIDLKNDSDSTAVSLTAEGETAGLRDAFAEEGAKIWRIHPQASFAEPVTIQIPLPNGASVDELALWYYSQSEGQQGWYLGENVEGWLVPNSMHIVERDDLSFLEFQVNHGGVFQLGKVPWFDVAPAGTVFVLFAALVLGFLLAPRRARQT